MAVFVVKTMDDYGQPIPGVFDELEAGNARIGWSWQDNQDLRVINLARENGEPLDEHQQDAIRCIGFLTRPIVGDYLIYPHQPERNRFSVVEVMGDYDYDDAEGGIGGDFRSVRPCGVIAPNVDIYDEIVPSQLRYRLGRPGRFSEVYDTRPFESFKRYWDIGKSGQSQDDTNTNRIRRIHNKLRIDLPDALRMEFSQADLSRRFCPELFERMGFTFEVQEGPNEAGSDLVVTVGNPLINGESRIGVQVFAYEGEVSAADFRQKLQQLVNGWETNNLDFGALLTTASCGDEIVGILDEHNRNNPDRQIKLIDGDALADLFLQYFAPGTE